MGHNSTTVDQSHCEQIANYDLFWEPVPPGFVAEMLPALNLGRRILREGVTGAEAGACIEVGFSGSTRDRDGVRGMRLRVDLFSFSSRSSFSFLEVS